MQNSNIAFRLAGAVGSLTGAIGLVVAATVASLVPIPYLTTPAFAQSCSGASAQPIITNASVNGTSINSSGDGGETGSIISASCTPSIFTVRACSTYASANSSGIYPWTLLREDGTTESGSLNNRIIVTPFAGPDLANVAQAEGVRYGNVSGSGNSIPIYVRYEAAPGAVVESGNYVGTIVASPEIVGTTTTVNPDAACSQYATYTTHISFGAVPISITINVPEECTTTIPPEMNFGDVSNTSVEHDMAADIRTVCNSNTLKYNVYIDDGTGSDNAALTMGDGSGHTLNYGLFNSPARNVAFERTGIGGAARDSGPFTRSTQAGGAIATIYGRVPIQSRPATGEYTDTVTVHVEY